ncbi:SEC-C domain-containing protein [Patescibacteria group bacterium]
MELEKCPCESGNPYKDCCFQKFDEKGNRLYDTGHRRGDSEGNWYPVPNTGIICSCGLKTHDPFREHAEKIVKLSKLDEKYHQEFVNTFGLFLCAYKHFIDEIQSVPIEGCISVRADTIAVRKEWGTFLWSGRILIDFLGIHVQETLALKEPLAKTFNAEAIESLIKNFKKEARKRPELSQLADNIREILPAIKDFIDVRNYEKAVRGGTIIEFPSVHQKGVVEDGEVRADGTKRYPMLKMAEASYKSICWLVQILIGVVGPKKSS